MKKMRLFGDVWTGKTTSYVEGCYDYYGARVLCEKTKKKDALVEVMKDVNEDTEFLISKSEYENENKVVALCCYESGEILTKKDLNEYNELFVTTGDFAISRDVVKYADYVQCGGCGKYFSMYRSDGIESDWGNYFCDECAESGHFVRQCSDCGKWFDISCAERTGMEGENENGDYVWYCDECSENYDYCDDCGRIIHNDEAWYEGDGVFCHECHEDRYGEDSAHNGNDTPIRSYHYAGSETDYGMHWLGSAERYENPLLGVELEIDLGGEDEDNAIIFRNIMGEDHCVICHDGSLRRGMEIISCPANYQNHKNLKWKELMEKALELGYRSHDPGTCGLHVHIDREFFKNHRTMTMEEIEGAFFIVLRNNIDWLKTFCRRKTWTYCEINGTEDTDDPMVNKIGKISTMGKYDEVWNKKFKKTNFNRYQAINFSRSDTIEFRLFRGTLKYSTFIASLQLVYMFAQLIKECDKLEDVMSIDFDSFVNMAKYNNIGVFYEFLDYCKDLGLIEEETGF